MKVYAWLGIGEGRVDGPFEAEALVHKDGTADLTITDEALLKSLEICSWRFERAERYTGAVRYDAFAWSPV